MDVNLLIAIASLVSGVGVATAAIVAVYTLRSQQAATRRQTELENSRWLYREWNDLRQERRAAARSLMAGKASFRHIREVLNFFETSGWLVRRHLIELETLDYFVGAIVVRGWWHWCEPFVRERRAWTKARIWGQVEWLQGQLESSHPDGPWLEKFLESEAEDEIDE